MYTPPDFMHYHYYDIPALCSDAVLSHHSPVGKLKSCASKAQPHCLPSHHHGVCSERARYGSPQLESRAELLDSEGVQRSKEGILKK
jgi:hypothetical protein